VPELPEVETVRRGLSRFVTGREVRRVEVRTARSVRRHPGGPADLAGRLAGRQVVAVERRGKYLWLVLDDEAALVAHLGMSGQLVLPAPAASPSPHLRVVVEFADGARPLHFVDQRTFGGLLVDELTPPGTGHRRVPLVLRHLAPDPLEEAFDPQETARRLRRRRSGVKRALLDQTLVSGIGNIYADEALWRARLHYARATDTLRPVVVRGLLQAVDEVLREAVAAGGTSFDALYVDVNGQSGWFSRSLHAYGQEGLPCPRCGRPIRREPFMNRSSYRCPRCQPQPHAPRW
jgi:formamidopyrimidine-DNA glycosylase